MTLARSSAFSSVNQESKRVDGALPFLLWHARAVAGAADRLFSRGQGDSGNTGFSRDSDKAKTDTPANAKV